MSFLIKYIAKNNYKIISVCSLIVLSIVLLSCYVGNPVYCDAPDICINMELIKDYDVVDSTLPRPEGETQLPVPGRRCPSCLERGDTVWVIPGKCCPVCGTPVN